MFLEDILEVIIVLASQYIFTFLNDINLFMSDSFFFLFGLLEVLADCLTLLCHLTLVLFLAFLLLLTFGF